MKNHLKRLKAPKTWKIGRKLDKFITRPNPGAYPFELGMPLIVVLRDTLGYAKTKREVMNILKHQEVKIDGKRTKDFKILVGLMSIISIPKIKKHFRVILNKKGKLQVIEIKEEEANLKVCKIVGKNMVKKRTQLGLFDGRSILVEKDEFKTGDSVLIEVPSQSIKKRLKLEKGMLIYLINGKHIGEAGAIEEIEGKKVWCKTKSGDKFETKKDYALVIGKDKPEITIENE